MNLRCKIKSVVNFNQLFIDPSSDEVNFFPATQNKYRLVPALRCIELKLSQNMYRQKAKLNKKKKEIIQSF